MCSSEPDYYTVINIMGDKIIYLVSIKDNDILSSSLPCVPRNSKRGMKYILNNYLIATFLEIFKN